MKIEEHTDEKSPIYMSDVYEELIGKDVAIFTRHPSAIVGKLSQYNGFVLRIDLANSTFDYAYVSVNQVSSISSSY